MKRKAQVIRYSEDEKRALCVDTEHWEAIYEYILTGPPLFWKGM